MAVVVLAFAGFILLGLPDGVLGVAWPSLSADLDRSLAELGVLLLFATAGYMAATALNGRLTQRLGTGPLLVISCVATSAGLFGYAVAPHWWLLLAISLALGAGGGLIDAGVNAYVAVNHGARVMNLLHASFGLGATLGPLIMTVALDWLGSWRWGYALLGAFQAVFGIAVWRYRDRWSGIQDEASRRATRAARPQPASRWLMGGMLGLFFLYTGLEIAAGQWSFTLLTRSRGIADGVAALWVAAYWGSFTGGRLLAGMAGNRISPELTLRLSMVGAVLSAAVFWWSPQDWIGNIGLAGLGFSNAAIFPSLVLLTPQRLGVSFAPWAIGYQLAAASVGAAVVPAAIGVAVAEAGLDAIGPGVFFAAAAMLLLAEVVERARGRLDPAAAAR